MDYEPGPLGAGGIPLFGSGLMIKQGGAPDSYEVCKDDVVNGTFPTLTPTFDCTADCTTFSDAGSLDSWCTSGVLDASDDGCLADCEGTQFELTALYCACDFEPPNTDLPFARNPLGEGLTNENMCCMEGCGEAWVDFQVAVQEAESHQSEHVWDESYYQSTVNYVCECGEGDNSGGLAGLNWGAACESDACYDALVSCTLHAVEAPIVFTALNPLTPCPPRPLAPLAPPRHPWTGRVRGPVSGHRLDRGSGPEGHHVWLFWRC